MPIVVMDSAVIDLPTRWMIDLIVSVGAIVLLFSSRREVKFQVAPLPLAS